MTAAGTAAAGAVFLSGRPSLTNWSNTGRGMSLASGLHLLNPAASAYFMYQGYQEGGLAGARDTAVWDVATNSAFAKYGYTKGAASAGMSSTKVARGFVGTSMRFAGAGIGAGIGQGIGQAVGIPGFGVAGAFIGGAVGAAPMAGTAHVMKGALRHPMLIGGAVMAGGAYAIGRGTSAILKAGAAHGASKRGIHTSGDLAAFSTRGAMTMRARAVQAIHKSHLNARSALGQEASLMAMPSRNYHSRYR